MSVEGRISLDVLFHDKDGTNAVNIVSFQDARQYDAGKVAVITGTASEEAVTINSFGATPYRDASGNLVTLNEVTRIVFAWSGEYVRLLSDTADYQFTGLQSKSGMPAMTDYPGSAPSLELSNGTGTGTYTIVLYGTA